VFLVYSSAQKEPSSDLPVNADFHKLIFGCGSIKSHAGDHTLEHRQLIWGRLLAARIACSLANAGDAIVPDAQPALSLSGLIVRVDIVRVPANRTEIVLEDPIRNTAALRAGGGV